MNKNYLYLFGILVLGLVVRIVLNNLIYSPDAESFIIWARYLADGNSISRLYETLPGNFLPYPPVYYYLLKIIGEMASIFNIWQSLWLSYLIVKLPVFIADVTIAVIIYLMTRSFASDKESLVASAFYFLNPAVIYITSVWGQIDSLVIMTGVLSLYLFFKKQYQLSFLSYSLGVLLKPHLLAIAPLIVVLALTLKKKEIITGVAVVFLTSLVVFMPILASKGFLWTVKYFYQLPHQYPYTSVYAYNVWAPLGFIISDDFKFLLPIALKLFSILIIATISLLIVRPFIFARRTPWTISPRMNANANTYFRGLKYLIAHVNLKGIPRPFRSSTVRLRPNRPRKFIRRFRPNLKTALFVAFLLFFNFALFSTRIHSRYLIYSLGLLAPFTFKFPKFTIFFTFLMFANLLLPNKEPILAKVVIILNRTEVVWLFTIYGTVLFIVSLKMYRKFLRENRKL